MVPGALAVSTKRRLARARKVDLPTLGRPTMAMTGRRSDPRRDRHPGTRGGRRRSVNAGIAARGEGTGGDLGRDLGRERDAGPPELTTTGRRAACGP